MRVLTTDVFCAGYLIVRGGRVIDLLVDQTGTRSTGTFVVEGAQVLADHEEYSRGQATANVKALRDAVTALRGRLAETLRRSPVREPRRSSSAR